MKHANKSASTQVQTSKIQVEVREIPVLKRQAMTACLDVDGDNGDLRNE